MRRTLHSTILVAVAALGARASDAAPAYKGMSYTSFNPNTYSGAGSDESLLRMSMLGTDTVAINFWWYQPSASSTDIRLVANRSASVASVEHAIDRAHELGLKVFLKPMLDIDDGTWRAYINPVTPAQRDAWFANYTNYIGQFADIAEAKGVELFSIGCEFNTLENFSNNQRWSDLITNVRSRYSGKVTYAANHDNGGIGGGYQSIGWWNQLDAIGIDAYFAISGGGNATPAQFQQAWNLRANQIENWRNSRGLTDKQVIFTEVGTGSWNTSTQTPWETPPQGGVMDEQEQAMFYDALLDVMGQRSWFDGAFWWNWEPSPNGAGPTSFTPQYKLASDVLAEHYGGVLPDYPLATWNTNNSGQWAGTNTGSVWLNGPPGNNHIALFDRGAAANYTVSLTANRTADQIIIGSNTVTFQSNAAAVRNLTADGQHTGADHRAIVVGVDAGDVGVMNVAPTIGTLTAAALTLGKGQHSAGQLNLAAPTIMNVTGSSAEQAVMEIGRAGVGALSIVAGAKLNAPSPSAHMILGVEPGSAGSVEVSSPGSTLTVGGTIQVGQQSYGELIVADGGVVTAPLVQIHSHGVLMGNGAIVGNVLNSGVVSPGLSPGTLTISGDFTQSSGGALVLEIASPTIFDKLIVMGAVDMRGAIAVEFDAAFTPSLGDAFDLLDFGSFGNLTSLELPQLPASLRWDASQFNSQGILAVVAVPEPAIGAMLAVALINLGVRRR